MKSLMRPGTGDQRLMDDAERRVAVLDAVGDDAQRDEVVDLLELDLLPLELLADAPQTLDAAVDLGSTGTCASAQLRGRSSVFSSSISPSVWRRSRVDLMRSCFVGLRLEIPERQLLELVLDLAHAEPVGDRRVDVARLLGDLDARARRADG
mgnify:CR=1 FL=1